MFQKCFNHFPVWMPVNLNIMLVRLCLNFVIKSNKNCYFNETDVGCKFFIFKIKIILVLMSSLISFYFIPYSNKRSYFVKWFFSHFWKLQSQNFMCDRVKLTSVLNVFKFFSYCIFCSFFPIIILQIADSYYYTKNNLFPAKIKRKLFHLCLLKL